MADIFISYASKNRQQADQLKEILTSAGVSVWIDQIGIAGGMDWGTQIVDALDAASMVIFLISPESVASSHCAKEVHLASEKKKKILPVVLEEVRLTPTLEYSLAGIQWVKFGDPSGILAAIRVHNITISASSEASEVSSTFVDHDGRLRLAVLPFDDLSAAKDNEWFADGMMDDLINTLGDLDKLRVNPRNDVIYYKGRNPRLTDVAADLKVRYIVSGSVQKAGEKIRIRVSVSDVTKHALIWSGKYDGTFDDVFDLQDKTCYAIAEAIKLTLTPEDERIIEKKSTDSAEAYELYLKAQEYFRRHTREHHEHAIALYEECTRLDPNFAAAYAGIANTCQVMARSYTRDPAVLERGERAVDEILRIEGESGMYFWTKSLLVLRRGKIDDALQLMLKAVERDPEYSAAYDGLSAIYLQLKQYEAAVKASEMFVHFRPQYKQAHFGLLAALRELGDQERLQAAAEKAIPVYSRHIAFTPEDSTAKAEYTVVLNYAGKRNDALALLDSLSASDSLGAVACYNLACLSTAIDAKDQAIALLRKAVEQGFRDVDAIRNDPDFDALREHPDFALLLTDIETLRHP